MRNGSPAVLALSATFQGVRSAPTDTVGEAADGKKPHGERVCVSVYPETSSGESERYVWVVYPSHLEQA